MSDRVPEDKKAIASSKELLLIKACEELEESIVELSRIIKISRVHRLQKYTK